jgi:hypothetical protein
MDAELLSEFNRALEELRERNIRVSPTAQLLLFMLIASVQDDQGTRWNAEVRRSVQRDAIAKFPEEIAVISRRYQTGPVDSLMILQYMPRFMSGFCPPFERPPHL